MLFKLHEVHGSECFMYAFPHLLGPTRMVMMCTDPSCVHYTCVQMCTPVGSRDTDPTPAARDTGVVLDSHLTEAKEMSAVSHAANLQLHSVAQARSSAAAVCSHLRPPVLSSQLRTLATVSFTSPDHLIHNLHLVQNSAARMVCCVKRRQHVTPLLHAFYWLPCTRSLCTV